MATIVIQAGHYPRTSGATGTGGLDGDPTEQEFTINAAAACARHLTAAGHIGHVIWADVPSHQYLGHAFVAIHCDGSTSQTARGASVGYRTSEGQRFAAAWKRHYKAQGWTGGFRPDNYTAALAGYYGTRKAVEQGTRMAFIAEAGFLTNPADEALLSLPAGPERFARALAAAVVEILGGQPPEDDMPTIEQLNEAARLGQLDDYFKRQGQILRDVTQLARADQASSIAGLVRDLSDQLADLQQLLAPWATEHFDRAGKGGQPGEPGVIEGLPQDRWLIEIAHKVRDLHAALSAGPEA